MRPSFFHQSVNGLAHGFFAAPLPRECTDFRESDLSEQWVQWEEIFEAAKRGDFSRTPELPGLFVDFEDTLNGAVLHLLAFAGSTACLDNLASTLPDLEGINTIEMTQALGMAGCLRDLPLVARMYTQLTRAGWKELEIIPVRLRDALGDPDHRFGDNLPLPEFEAGVLARCQDLVAALGPRATVFGGELVSPARFARRLLEESTGDHGLILPLRLHFEAYTGIDCSSFYRDHQLQPLDVVAVAERFLASHESTRFLDGERYFFGHRVP